MSRRSSNEEPKRLEERDKNKMLGLVHGLVDPLHLLPSATDQIAGSSEDGQYRSNTLQNNRLTPKFPGWGSLVA